MYKLFSFTQYLTLYSCLHFYHSVETGLWKDHQDLLVPRSYSFFSVLTLFDFPVILDIIDHYLLVTAPCSLLPFSSYIPPTPTAPYKDCGYSCVLSFSLSTLILVTNQLWEGNFQIQVFVTSRHLYLDLCIQVYLKWKSKTKLILYLALLWMTLDWKPSYLWLIFLLSSPLVKLCICPLYP